MFECKYKEVEIFTNKVATTRPDNITKHNSDDNKVHNVEVFAVHSQLGIIKRKSLIVKNALS